MTASLPSSNNTPVDGSLSSHSSNGHQNELHIPGSLNFLAPIFVNDPVRVGRHYDGGYVVPMSVVKEVDRLISFGISDDWSFDAHFLRLNPKVMLYAYDHTISGKIFLKNILFSIVDLLFADTNPKQVLSRLRVWLSYLMFFTGRAKHFQQRINNRTDCDVDVTLQKIFDGVSSEKMFLKVDIEGGEYRILHELSGYSPRIIGMVIEFHDTDRLRHLFTEAIAVLRNDYHIVHIHANNYGSVAADEVPEVLEITFVRKDHCSSICKVSAVPHKRLDAPNDPSRVDYALKFDEEK